MNNKLLIRLILFCLVFFSNCKENSNKTILPSIQKGILDLRNFSEATSLENSAKGFYFENTPSINLEGEWNFFWNEFIPPFSTKEKTSFIPVPSQWQNHGFPIEGFATYKLNIILPKDIENLPTLSIKMTDAGTNYELYINGKLLGTNGKSGKNKNDSTVFMKHEIFSLDQILKSLKNSEDPKLEILFYVSNFHYFKSGLWDSIKLGRTEIIEEEQKYIFIRDLFLMSALFIMGIYHIGLFLNRRKDSSPFYFGAFCLLFVLRILSINERMILDVFPFIPFIIIHKLELITFYLGSVVFLEFVCRLFPDEFSDKLKWSFRFAVLPTVFLVIFTPIGIYGLSLTYVQIIVLIGIIYVVKVLAYAIKHRRIGARLFLLGWIFFAGTMVHDILKTRNILITPYLGSYGFLIFIIFQASILSRKFSNAFSRSENLAEELQSLTASLEIKVKERTKDLEVAKKETDDLNNLIKNLNQDPNLDTIINYIFHYIKDKYNINFYILSLVAKNKKNSEVNYIHIPDFFNEELSRTIKNLSFPLDSEYGVHYVSYKNKKIFFIPNTFKKSKITEEEKFVLENVKMESILIIPLMIHNEVFGFLDLFNMNKLKLKHHDILNLSKLGEHLAGIIYSSNLYKEIKNAWNEAEIEKGIAQIAQKEAEKEKLKSEKLLLNILPREVAFELKEKGFTEPVLFNSVTVMFTDFKGFTQIAQKLQPHELIKELDSCFVQFDKIVEKYDLEKLKTIGDSYMCAAGIPNEGNPKKNAIRTTLAALEILHFMNEMRKIKEMINLPFWEVRLGIHSGPLIAGVIGEKKFAYDVWGDTVNTASRMETSGTPGIINISGDTYTLIKDFFISEYRGKINAKNKGAVDMYYIYSLKNEFMQSNERSEERITPNLKFWEKYADL